MKKALTLTDLGIWTLGLLAGLWFAVAGEVTGANDLPYKNQVLRLERQSLASERDVLLGTIAAERTDHAGRVNNYETAMARLRFQNKMMIESLRSNRPVTSLFGPGPHEE